VYNSANRGSVTGPAVGTSGAGGEAEQRAALRAFPAAASGGDPRSAASKLEVGPAFLPRALYGPYWIVSAQPSANASLGYDWAIVAAGPPTAAGKDGGCRVGGTGGLWFFTRAPKDVAATAAMEARARESGLDTSAMVAVQQAGCSYPA
jgi:apolipoprotein D and lipocalin family protein